MVAEADKNSFGTRLRTERTAAGLSLRALARSTELDPAYLSRVERGHNPAPKQAVIQGLAQALCRARELVEADCERLRRSLLGAAGRLTDERTLITDLRCRFADRLRDEGVEDWAVDAAIRQVDLDTMQRVLVGDEPLEIAPARAFSAAQIRRREASEPVVMLSPSEIRHEPGGDRKVGKATQYLDRIKGQFTAPKTRAGRLTSTTSDAATGKPRNVRIRAGTRATIEVSGVLTKPQQKQLRQLARLIESLLEQE